MGTQQGSLSRVPIPSALPSSTLPIRLHPGSALPSMELPSLFPGAEELQSFQTDFSVLQ